MRSDRTEEERTADPMDGAPDGEAERDAEVQASGASSDPADTEAAEGGDASGSASEVRAELEDLRNRHLRLAAEYDNYRKRTERERSDSFVKAQSQLVQKLLDAVDDLERVADYTPETTTVGALLEGVQMVERKLLKALEAAGLERLDAHGAVFNPLEHEALMTAATESPQEDDTVGEVFQKGYRFQGHLLRPARVQVRKHGG